MSDITRLGLLGVSLLGLGSLFLRPSKTHQNPLPTRIKSLGSSAARKTAAKKMIPYIKTLYHAGGLPLSVVAECLDISEEELRSFMGSYASEGLVYLEKSRTKDGQVVEVDQAAYMHTYENRPTNYELLKNLVQEALLKKEDPAVYIANKFPPTTPEIVRLWLNGEGILTFLGADYRGSHKAPDASNSPLFDVTLTTYPKNFYDKPQIYIVGGDEEWEHLPIVNTCRGNPTKDVTIYRAVPEYVNEIYRGDWVTLTKNYAKLHLELVYGAGRDPGKGKIISKKVCAKELFTAGDSLSEWGYWPEDF
jgi:hypothetical protein